MTDKQNQVLENFDGLEVVAWQHVFADGKILSYIEDQAGFPARGDALKVEPLVTLASAQAAVAISHDRWQDELHAWANLVMQRNQRLTELESALGVAREALEENHLNCHTTVAEEKYTVAIALIDTLGAKK